jgi:hypothetical protein
MNWCCISRTLEWLTKSWWKSMRKRRYVRAFNIFLVYQYKNVLHYLQAVLFIQIFMNIPYSPSGKRKIRDPFKDKIDSSRWFNADHDRGQILSFSSPSRNHVDRGSVVMSAQWANVLYKPTCTKYLGRIKFVLKKNVNVVIFIACGFW